MIMGTFNIRGGGSLITWKRISRIICNGREDMFLIQETELKEVSESVANIFLGMEDIGFSFSAANGMAGGL